MDTVSTDTAYDAAIKYAADLGSEHGRNAASWYVQDVTRDDPARVAGKLLRGIEDGDPAVLDGFSFADLSGEWADSLTGPQLVSDAWASAGHDPAVNVDIAEGYSDICDAYETAFSSAVEDAIASAARAILA